jgi:hypothetical protein
MIMFKIVVAIIAAAAAGGLLLTFAPDFSELWLILGDAA